MSLSNETRRIEINQVNAFLACLSLGTLYAIKEDVLPPEVAIWALGAPKVWETLLEDEAVSAELIDVFQTCDELSAIKKLMPEKFSEQINSLMERIEAVLRETGDSVWELRWISNLETGQ